MFGSHIQEHQQELRKSISDSYQPLEKGGEGSKGGKVVGHTKSGAPIYETIADIASPEAYTKFLKKHNIRHIESGMSFKVHKDDYDRIQKVKSKHYQTKDDYHTHGTGFSIERSKNLDKDQEHKDKWEAKQKEREEKEKAKRPPEHSKELHEKVMKVSGDSTLKFQEYDINDRAIYVGKKNPDIEYTVDKKGNVYSSDGRQNTKIGSINS